MQNCTCANLYENEVLRESLGETLRPGGFKLTERAAQLISLKPGDKVLDIGSGMGDTVNYLNKNYSVDGKGVEPSEILINEAGKKYPGICILKGTGESIPADDCSMDAVFAECTMSLMDDLEKVICESHRVLKFGGSLVITDVYARNSEHLEELNQFKMKSCLRGMLDLQKLHKWLFNQGFYIQHSEDHTDCLKQLTVNLIFKFGSMALFWKTVAGCGEDMDQFKEILSRCKPGYFLIVCKKDLRGLFYGHEGF